MKKLLLSIIFFVLTTCAFAQKDSIANSVAINSAAIGHGGNNELKVNLMYLVLGLAEVSYERLLTDNMGVGLSALVSLEDDHDVDYAFISSYRLYFGNKKANGFFVEGNMGLISETTNTYYYSPENNGFYNITESQRAYFGLGAAAGAKFLTRNGFLGEAYLGAGRLLGSSYSEFYPRLGITIGKRF